jgi:molybdate transport system ATP-binding protein
MVFQDYLLFPHLSAADNVAFGLRAAGVRKGAARQQALRWLDRMGLAELSDARPARLSGGQAQRVALARALATSPRLLLLDEPLAALDAGTRITVRSDLRRHLTAYPGCTVLVTHDPLDAMVLADQLVVLEQGRVVQSGPPGEVARAPRTEYVARLVGLNLYRGHAQAPPSTSTGAARSPRRSPARERCSSPSRRPPSPCTATGRRARPATSGRAGSPVSSSTATPCASRSPPTRPCSRTSLPPRGRARAHRRLCRLGSGQGHRGAQLPRLSG